MYNIKKKQNKRRSKIIESLIPIISTVSFDDITVAQLCEAADISIGTFYHYFNGKTDITVGLLSLIDEYMETDVFPVLTSEDELENLRRFAHGWAEYVNAHGIERSRVITAVEPSDIDFSGQKRTTVIKLEEIILRGQEKKQISKMYSCEELSELFLLSLRGVTTDWSRHNGSYSVTDKMDRYIAFIVESMRV